MILILLFDALTATIMLATSLERDETLRAYGAANIEWHLEELRGASFDGVATLTFPAKGKIMGDGPCNRYTGANTVPYPWFDISPIVATRRACPDLAAETAFFAALEAAALSEVLGDLLILSDDSGPLLVFKAAD